MAPRKLKAKEFVADMRSGMDDKALLRKYALSDKELETVRKLGCKKIQGYYFGRPMSAADALALFSTPRFRERLAS